jgi:uncharacterized protein YggE
MEDQSVQRIVVATHYPRVMVSIALGMLALFLFVLTLSTWRSYQYIGAGISATNTISVSGEGKIMAKPDVATFTYTVSETAPDQKAATDKATKSSVAILAYLKSVGVEDKDIQTTDYSVSPQYSYSNQICTNQGYCPPQKQTINGYQVSQSNTVKVHALDKAGEILGKVGSLGVSYVSGLNLTLDDVTKKQAEARQKAIDDAKGKAEALAKSLGVSIVRITGFSENGGGGPVPMYAKMDMAAGMTRDSAPSPEISVGQNTIMSTVNITYEIR